MDKENTFQFCHNQYERKTYAVDVNFSKEALINMLHNFSEPLVLQVGVSQVHPDDQFVKSIGREVALDYLEDVEVKVKNVVIEEKRALFYLKAPGFVLCFRIHEDSDKPHFINACERTDFEDYF